MEADMKSGFGFNTHSLSWPEDNIPNFSPIISTLLPFPPDYYLSVGTTPFSQLPPLHQPPLQTLPLNSTTLSKKKQREKISDRTRSLQKLLPGNKRLKTADMLEEAYQYVKFLQAQVRALHSMPLISTSTGNVGGTHESDYGVLGLLNRQQLLQVLLNSPPVQTKLYSQGLCVCSLEQLLGAFVGTHTAS